MDPHQFMYNCSLPSLSLSSPSLLYICFALYRFLCVRICSPRDLVYRHDAHSHYRAPQLLVSHPCHSSANFGPAVNAPVPSTFPVFVYPPDNVFFPPFLVPGSTTRHYCSFFSQSTPSSASLW